MNRENKSNPSVEEIITEWQSGKMNNWRLLSTNGKKNWLKACVHWTGLPNSKIISDTYRIDSLQITDEPALFCLLGEVFFGHKGYFGQSLYGLNDCFTEISMHTSGKVIEGNASLIIQYHEELKKIMDQTDEAYFDHLVNSFRQSGFTVELD